MITNSLFVDTSGWMAYLIDNETYHAHAKQELQQAIDASQVAIYTTDHVIAELVALMIMTARHAPRQQILDAVGNLLVATRITKLYTDQTLFIEAWELLQRRSDKAWSLVDAISMCQMKRFGVTEILTNDHHFDQAGFTLLLR